MMNALLYYCDELGICGGKSPLLVSPSIKKLVPLRFTFNFVMFGAEQFFKQGTEFSRLLNADTNVLFFDPMNFNRINKIVHFSNFTLLILLTLYPVKYKPFALILVWVLLISSEGYYFRGKPGTNKV